MTADRGVDLTRTSATASFLLAFVARDGFNGAMDISNTVLSWMPIAVIAVAACPVIRFALRLSRR